MKWIALRLIAAGVLGFCTSCGPTPSSQDPERGEEPQNPVSAAPDAGPEPSFLDPILGNPWLGHGESGNLVKLEFFVNASTAETLCRVNVIGSVGGLRPQQSTYSATADLSTIVWDDGKSRGRFVEAEKALDVTITTNAGIEKARLKQVSAKENPELGSYRRFVPDDELARAANKKFVERLGRGTRWWQSGLPWEKVITPPKLEAPAKQVALIWPTQAKPITLPAMKVGDDFQLPITCHLPPGTRLADADMKVGVFMELQSKQNQSSTWIFQNIHPGASVQEVTANWKLLEGDLPPTGECTLFIYLVKVMGDSGSARIDINQPISNLLKVDVTISE